MSTTNDTLPDDFAGLEELGSADNIEKLLDDLTPIIQEMETLLKQREAAEDLALLLHLAGAEVTNASAAEPPVIDPNATATDVALWMQQALRTDKDKLYHSRVERHIRRFFGLRFLYRDRFGVWAIAKEVLKEYKRLTETSVVWIKSERYWRLRREGDPPTRSV